MDKKVEIYTTKPKFDSIVQFKSIFQQQLLELAEIRNPKLSKPELSTSAKELSDKIIPTYIYYPWRNQVIETVSESEFMEIKTNRNKQLLTKEEQKVLYNLSVSIAGMSVGSSILYGLVGSGICKKITIADDDILSTANLNRVQATLLDVYESKVVVAYRRAMEMNPFLDISVINKRINEKNSDDFFEKLKFSIVFEEIDDFKMKVLLREQAKQLKIPYVMMTNLGDSVLIDIERYDTEPETKPFNGLVSDEIIKRIKSDTIDQELMKELSVELVDKSLVQGRALTSLKEIGNTLVGRPQLYSTVALDGGIAAYICRRIAIENNIVSGRYSIKLDSISKHE